MDQANMVPRMRGPQRRCPPMRVDQQDAAVALAEELGPVSLGDELRMLAVGALRVHEDDALDPKSDAGRVHVASTMLEN